MMHTLCKYEDETEVVFSDVRKKENDIYNYKEERVYVRIWSR